MHLYGGINCRPLTKEALLLIFARISNGDEKAFEQLFRERYDDVFSTAFGYGRSRELARDATQHVFLKVWERRELLKAVDNPQAWLHTAARYQSLHLLKQEMQKDSYLSNIMEALSSDVATPEKQLYKRDQEQFLTTVIARLPAKQQEIYLLSREEGLTYAEIGKRLGLAHETIKDYMAKALKTLRQLFNEHKDDLITALIFFQSFF